MPRFGKKQRKTAKKAGRPQCRVRGNPPDWLGRLMSLPRRMDFQQPPAFWLSTIRLKP